MSRSFLIVVFAAATLLGGLAAVAGTTGLRYAVAVPETDMPSEPGQERTPGDEAAKPGKRVAAARGISDKTYLKTVLCRNLFDPSKVGECDLEPKSATPEDDEPTTDLDLTLLGTLLSEPARYSSAFIQNDGDDRPYGYSIGDKIGDAEVIGIEAKLVRLRRGDGREEVLRMDGEEAPKKEKKKEEPEKGDDGDIQKLGEDEYAVSADLLDEKLSDLDGLSKMARAYLHRGPDGDFDGYRLSAIRRGTLADKLGIKNGDVIHSVNGKPLNSMASAMEAYQTMQNEKNFSFDVTRRGKTKTMKYSVR